MTQYDKITKINDRATYFATTNTIKLNKLYKFNNNDINNTIMILIIL